MMNEYEKIKEEIQQEMTDAKENILYSRLFKLYKKDKDLAKLISRAENGDYDTYTFDESGMLCGVVQFETSDYPYLQEFLDFTMQPGFITEYGIEMGCGECISVNWNAGRNEYFIYNHETGKPIVAKRDDEKPEEYYHAVIEQHMRKAGYFPDVVTVDYYGQYVAHVDTKMGRMSDEEVQAIIDSHEKTEEDSDND